MKTCDKDCIPCCNFCVHVEHGNLEKDGTDGPIGCRLHPDQEHQELAIWCNYCDDFYCANNNEYIHKSWLLTEFYRMCSNDVLRGQMGTFMAQFPVASNAELQKHLQLNGENEEK